MKRIFSGRDARLRAERGFAWRFLLALAVLHAVLLLPIWPDNIRPVNFVRFLPVELPALVLLLALPSASFGRWVRGLVVAALSTIAVIKIANITAFTFFARAFNPVVDPFLIPIAVETLAKTNIPLIVAVAVGVLLLIALVVLLFAWVARVVAAPSRRAATVTAGLLLALAAGVLWSAPRIIPAAAPLKGAATVYASHFVCDQIGDVKRSFAARAQFRRDVAADPFNDVPRDRLLARLKGKDVLLIFVEAYGAAALADPAAAPSGELARWEAALAEAGYAMRSAWLTSPTFGGASWLAHGTFVSGLWIADHQRYNSLFVSDRRTLIADFRDAGWRTAAVMPLFTRPWPEGKFFGYDAIYAARDLGYAGPDFGYITMPDQYTLAAFHRREMTAAPRAPVMAEIALSSSHLPWTPRPRIVPWEDIGDGRVFAAAREGSPADIDWLNPSKMRASYMRAVTYALESVFSYAATQVTEPALIIVVGDHQPIPLVAGTGAPHEVPIHVLSRDPADLAAFAAWTAGLRPGAQSPVWKMDAMRAHILESYSADILSHPPPS